MTLDMGYAGDRRRQFGGAIADAGTAMALAAAMAICLFMLDGGVLADARADNDSLLRLVQVRDLLAGQGWYDPVQQRMGLEGGFAMHWSRLVDLPIAALILVFGETTGTTIWPALLFAVCLFLIVRTVGILFGQTARFPAFAIGGVTLFATGLFRAGTLDHHNLQVTLALLASFMLVQRRGPGLLHGITAGGAAAAMGAVAAEGVPMTAAAGIVAAGGWLLAGGPWTLRTRGFGLGFAVTALAIVPATIAPDGWLAATCDAYSGPQGALAGLAGFGLAAATCIRSQGWQGRLLALAVLGGACAAGAALTMSHCLADPYAAVDPRLRAWWLSAIGEAQSVASVWRNAPALFLASYATPALALAITLWRLLRKQAQPGEAAVAVMLAMALLVSFWQVRGAQFGLPIAAILLAGWVARQRQTQPRHPTGAATAMMAAAWIASFHVSWQALGALVFTQRAEPQNAAASDGAPSACYRAEDYRRLASLAPDTVLAISNIGSPILAHAGHRVLSGPYHRNQAGNLAALDALAAPVGADRESVVRTGAGILAVCTGNDESRFIASLAPEGLLARIASGHAPEWLQLLPETSGEALQLYKVLR